MVIEDGGGFYREMLRHFIEMVRTGVMPIPATSMLEILRILAAASRSRETGEAARM